MRTVLFLLMLALSSTCLPQKLRAQEAQKKPVDEPIPAPKQKFPPVPQAVPVPLQQPLPILLPDMPRPGTREVWQYYAVDSFGRFRPRVILAPGGAYYYRSLEPYPWVQSRSTRFMPWARD